MLLRNITLFACAGLLGLSVACSEMHQAMAPERADTREADMKAVKDVEAAWAKDAASKDPDKFASYYAEDASLLMPGAPVIVGKEGVKNAIKPLMADPNFALTFSSNKAEAAKSGELVYTVGSYSMTLTGPDKKPTTEKGKYTTIFRKQADASWKAVVDALNADAAH